MHHTEISENVCLLIIFFTINLVIHFEFFVDLNCKFYGNSLFFFLKAIHHTGISENVCLLIFTINLIFFFLVFCRFKPPIIW